MICGHEAEHALADYIRGTLSDAQAAMVNRHLDGCSECRLKAGQLELLLPRLRDEVGNHVPAEILVDYHDLLHGGSLSEGFGEWTREEIEGHVSLCDRCQTELKMLASMEEELSASTEPAKALSTHVRQPRRFSAYFRSRRLGYGLIGVAAVVLMAVLIAVQRNGLPRVDLVEVDRLSSSDFAGPLRTRGGETEVEGPIPQDPQEAATDEFMRRIELVEGQYWFVGPEDQPEVELPGRRILLRLVDSRERTLREFTATVPFSEGFPEPPSGMVQAWLIALPSRNLLRVEMVVDSVEAVWAQEMGERICVTFTYRADQGFAAARATCVDLENNSQNEE